MRGGVVLDLRCPEDDLPLAAGCGGRRARPGGRHCEQRLGKGPARPPGPATSWDAHQMRHSTPLDLHGIVGGQVRRHLVMRQLAHYDAGVGLGGGRGRRSLPAAWAGAAWRGGSSHSGHQRATGDQPRGHGGARGPARYRHWLVPQPGQDRASGEGRPDRPDALLVRRRVDRLARGIAARQDRVADPGRPHR